MLRCQSARAIDLESHQVAVLAEHVQAVAVDGRCAAWSRSSIVGLRCAERLRPDFFPIRTIERYDDAVAAASALDEDEIARYRH
jgi:hypothetical protein